MRLGEAEQALLFDAEAGYLNTQGRDALERAPSVLEAFGAAQAQLAATLGDQDQRRMFETLSASRQADFAAQVTRHGDAERQRWHDAASERRIAQARVEAGRHWNDDTLLRRALLTARAELGDQARRHGWADSEAAARLRQEAGRMLAAAIEAAADRDPGRAQALYARDGRMLDAPSRAAIDTLLAETRLRERAAAQSAALLREVPAPQARIARAAAIAEPALRTATLGLLRSADATAEARARALGEQVLALVLAEGLTDPSQVPVRDWAMLDAVRRAAIAARLDHNARGEEPPPDPALADALVRQMTHEPQAFARRDLVPLVATMPLDRWQRLRAWQAGLRRDDRDTVEQVHAIRRGLQLAGQALPPDTPDDEAMNYRAEVVDEIDTWHRIHGKSPGDDDIRAMLASHVPHASMHNVNLPLEGVFGLPSLGIETGSLIHVLLRIFILLERLSKILRLLLRLLQRSKADNDSSPPPQAGPPPVPSTGGSSPIQPSPPSQSSPPVPPVPAPQQQAPSAQPKASPPVVKPDPLEQILRPGGHLIGRRGSNSAVRMVSKAEFLALVQRLKALSGQAGIFDPRYGGYWFSIPGGRFGIRSSKRFGPTIDIDHPLVRKGFKVHAQ